jgi:tetratricopeptide (TPR) repeat protein/tRNA A-37 threonylcarbamoyl transferase component Bud32
MVESPTGDSPPTTNRPALGRIGRYTLIGKLGEGGMGIVWEARQESPQRSVALKVVRGGTLGDEAAARLFQREAETLARLDHPNIAAVYEAGTTDDGQHYFAMELVRGVTLDRWLRQRPGLDTPGELEARLRIFGSICEAVQYAHQKGVIHRDLKPGNIVATQAESGSASRPGSGALPLVKVLDFGLARITDEDLGAASLQTEVGVIKGTLAYMSPEQARGDPAAIDTRCDVYALGVLLYQLLSGRLPLDLSGLSVMESLRRVTDQDPVPLQRAWPASTRLDPDLITIVHKALAKQPGERYSSAAALAEDVVRFLTSQPILARPPSTLYQLRKLIARRKAPFAAAGVALVLLVAFGVAMSVLYARSERLRRRAEEAEHRAAENFELARGAVDRYFTEISESPALQAYGLEDLRRSLLETARSYYADFVERRGDDPELRAELGSAQIRLANIARVLAETEQAEQAIEEGRRLFTALLEDDPGNLHYRRELAVLEGNLGLLLADIGRPEEAEAAYERTIALEESIATEPDHRASDDARRANAIDNLGQLVERAGRLEESRALITEAIEVREALLRDHPDEPEYVLALVQGYNNLAIQYPRQGQTAPALPLLERAIELAEELNARHPDDSRYENILAASYSNLAGVRMLEGRLDEAIELYTDELATRRELVRSHPGVVEYEIFLGSSLTNLGEAEARAGRHEAALPRFGEALEVLEGVLDREPRHVVGRAYASYTHSWRAGSLEALGRPGEAVGDWERAVELDDRGDPSLREGLERARAAAGR